MSAEKSNALVGSSGDVGCPAGYAGAMSADDQAVTAAGKYLNDASLLANLTDRVYQLLQEDLYLQRERISNYSRSRWS